MKPQKLRATRDEYKEFPVKVFGKRVHGEVDKQISVAFWADKRNKQKLKKYLKHLTEIKETEEASEAERSTCIWVQSQTHQQIKEPAYRP